MDFGGELRHRWQKENNGDWSSWSLLGGAFLPGVAVGVDADGELEVFTIDETHNLNCARQLQRNGHEWSQWNNLGGGIDPPAVVGRDADGRLELFARDVATHRVKHLWQTNLQGGWSRWSDLGTGAADGLTVATNDDGRLELLGVNESHQLIHCWEQAINESENWSEWASLGGAVLPGIGVCQNDEGQLEVFAVSAGSNAVERIVQSSAGNSSRWQPWTNFGGDIKPGIAVGQNADGRLEVFAVKNGSSTLQHLLQLKRHEDRWMSWRDLGEGVQSAPVIGHNRDGTLEIFAADERNGLEVKHRRQIIANYHWLYWSSMDESPPEYSARVWQTDEGLPGNRVQAIAQTRDGFLWVGTSEGLARFDGVEFKTYNGANTPQLKSASITSLCADADGALWIGTDGGGLARLFNGEFSLFTKADGLVGDNVRAILRGGDGTIWIASAQGLSRLHDGKFQSYTTREGLLSDQVTALCEDRGYIWVATVKGLNRLRGKAVEAFTATNIMAESLRSHWSVRSGAMDALAATKVLSDNQVRSLCLDRTHRLWIGSDYGLMWYDTGNFYAYTTHYGLSDNFVSTVQEDSQNNLWVGTYSGLNRFIDGQFNTELNSHGMPYDQINVVLEDSLGNIWVGSREGLIRLTPKPFEVKTRQQGLSHNHVTSVLQDHLGGLWVGTWGGGLNQLTEEKVKVFGTTNQLSSDLILAVCESHDGAVWAGTDKSGGLYRIKDRHVSHYTSQEGLIDASITALHEDRKGNLWVGTGKGLCRLNGRRFVIETNIASAAIRAICESADGDVWFGGDVGLMRWRNGAITDLSAEGAFPSKAVSALFAESDGSVWVGSSSEGLFLGRNDHWRAFGIENGLYSNEILGIAEDHGWLWLTSTKGIFRVRQHDLEVLGSGNYEPVPCVVYGKADGLESIVCGGMATPSVWKTTDDQLCFATTLGLAVINARDTGASLAPPPVYIEQVDVDRKPFSFLGQLVKISPNHGELDIRYSALDLRAAEKCRYKYRLDGVDSDWVDVGTQRAAHYNHVAPGSYRFRVLACNKDGVWNESGGDLNLELRPHFWQTWWFKMLAGATLLCLVGGSVRIATQRKMQRKLELIERRHAIERERGRIAKDIHDDLGSSLTRIMLLGQRAKSDLAEQKEVDVHLNKIISFSQSTVQAMDEIVWAVNPRNDNLDGLVNYLAEFADQFFQDSKIRCRLQMPISSQLVVPTEVRHDLFLAIKEALNNVLKHSMASEVRIEVLSAESTINVVIDDNGRGFDLGQRGQNGHGNGLQNMRRRMDAVGGQMDIVTTPGHGTKLQFTVSVPGQPPPD